MHKNSVLSKSLILFTTFLVIFIFLEIISHSIEKKYFFNTEVYVQRAKPVLHKISDIPGLSYELMANAKTEQGFYSINSKGIRDREFEIPKPDGVFRIIVLGDSVTFGTEYPVEMTYPKILERLLNAESGSKLRYEVLNAGVCSYNAVQKFILLKNKLLDYQPDMVIMQFLNDDYYRNAVFLPGNKNLNKKNGFISMGEYFSSNFPQLFALPYPIDRLLMKHMSFYRVMNKRLYDSLSIKNPDKYPPQAYKFAAYEELEDSMQVNKAAFEKFHELSLKSNFQFFLLMVPELKADSRMDAWIKNSCLQKYGFASIDLKQEFEARNIDLKDLRIVPEGICHLNENGHRITAQIIKTALERPHRD